MEAAGGIVLVIAAALALIVANSPLNYWYDLILNGFYLDLSMYNSRGEYELAIDYSVLYWVNDGLMAIFFFLIGLEIKREFVEGELSSKERALLPALAAIGGMVVPAGIYYMLNADVEEYLRGWAVPAATDIAFALGVISLLGKRAPMSLKILLTAIAVIDDLLAILIIAIFYSKGINPEPLYFAGAALLVLLVLNRMGVTIKIAYLVVGLVLWAAVLKSGIHATLAGVTAALFIPLAGKKDPSKRPAEEIEHALHPWVAFAVLPIFGFANAGVPFKGMGIEALYHPVTLGIALGLFVGKQLGIFSIIWVVIKTGLAPKPSGADWIQLYAVSALCGIGFTMSLFIGGLAFDDLTLQADVRLGVIMGSVCSAVLGYSLLRYSAYRREQKINASAANSISAE